MTNEIGTVTMYPSGERAIVDCAQFATVQAVPTMGEAQSARLALMFPDPRDERIAHLEAALRDVQRACVDGQSISEDGMRAMFVGLHRFIGAALVWSPERDMEITHEELGA